MRGERQISDIERVLNARQRKCIYFRQPDAVFGELSKAAKFIEWCTSELNSNLVVRAYYCV